MHIFFFTCVLVMASASNYRVMITCVEEIHIEYDYNLYLKIIFDNLIMFSTVTEECIWHLVSRILHTLWVFDKVSYQIKLLLWNSYMTFFTSFITLTNKIRKSNEIVCLMKYYYSIPYLLFLLSFLLIHSKVLKFKIIITYIYFYKI
jgi:hypothetical protein